MRFNTASAALALGLLGSGLALPHQPVPAVPAPSQEPTVQTPTVQAPTVQSSTAQAPTAQAPTAQAPTAQAPTVQAATEKGSVEKGSVEKAPVEKAPTTNSNSAKAAEQIKDISSKLLDASKLLEEIETEDPATKAFLTQVAGFVNALASGVQLSTVKEPAIGNGVFRNEKGGDVYLGVGNTYGPIDNSVKGVDATANRKLKEIWVKTLRLLNAGKLTGAYDPEWEYEARELRELLDELE